MRCIGKRYIPEAYQQEVSWYLQYTPYEIHETKTTDFSPLTRALIADVESGVESPAMIDAWAAMTDKEKEVLKYTFTDDYQSYLKKIQNQVKGIESKVNRELLKMIPKKEIDVEAEFQTLD